MKIAIQSTVSKITTMADKSVRLQIDTQELDSNQMADVFGAYGQIGYFLFSEKVGEVEAVKLDDLPAVSFEKGTKTPSQRLRAVFHILWEQTQDTKKISSEEFYRLEMEKLINHYKNKLN